VRLHHEVASSDIRWSSCKPVVRVTLGGCHLLDGLVVYDCVEAREKIVRSSREGFVRGICAHLAGSAKSNSSKACH
jgi:hypothetical protein